MMKKILLSLILLSCISILSIVNTSYIHPQGYLSLSQPSPYLAQYGYQWEGQGFTPDYFSQNNFATQLWSTPNYFSQAPVYAGLGSLPSLPSFVSPAFPSAYGLPAYGLNVTNYGSASQANQSSILPSMLSRTSSNTILNTTLPFINFSLSNYYPQGIGSLNNNYFQSTGALSQMNLFYQGNNAYMGNLGSSLSAYNKFPSVASGSFPTFNNFSLINPYTTYNTYNTYNTFSLISPYQPKNSSYKGQIHCHTTNSDGADSPADLVTAYKNAGYGFIVVTDHDFVTTTPSVPGIRFIQGCEETASTGHIGRLACSTQTTESNAQAILDTIRANGGISILNHPWGTWHIDDYVYDWTVQEIERLYRYDVIEIFNGNQQERKHNAEMQWDSALSRGIFVPGVATDDCHNIAGSGFNQGWIVVYADTDSEAAILSGIRNGNFYSSSGPDLTLSVSSLTITATTGTSSTIAFIGNNGSLLQTKSATTAASYTAKGSERYVRVKVTRDTDRKSAWSNPIVINN